MTIEEATDRIKKMAELHGGKFQSKANFRFNEGGIVHLDDTTDPTVVSNEEAEAPCTVLISLDNLEKMLAGEMNPMMAFMTGKMKIEGDNTY